MMKKCNIYKEEIYHTKSPIVTCTLHEPRELKKPRDGRRETMPAAYSEQGSIILCANHGREGSVI